MARLNLVLEGLVKLRVSLAVAIFAGTVAGAAVVGLMEALAALVLLESPWNATLSSVLISLSPICPGLVAGYLAARSGFLVGSIASALTSIVDSIYAALIVRLHQLPEQIGNPAIPQEIIFALVAILVGGVSGIAGVALATRGNQRRSVDAF
jgi:hypothetical protein